MMGLARKILSQLHYLSWINCHTSAKNFIYTYISLLNDCIYTPSPVRKHKKSFGVGFGNWSICEGDRVIIGSSSWMHVSDYNMQSLGASSRQKKCWCAGLNKKSWTWNCWECPRFQPSSFCWFSCDFLLHLIVENVGCCWDRLATIGFGGKFLMLAIAGMNWVTGAMES